MALVDACRTRSWHIMFHLRLIEEYDVEVLVAPSFRSLRRHAEPMRLRGAQAQVQHRILGKELHGLLQGLLDRDVL